MELNFEAHKEGTTNAGVAGVRERVKSVISQVTKLSASEISGEKTIRDDLAVDSMQAIESLAILEKEFNIIIDPEKAFNVVTVNDLFALIEESIHASKGVA